MKKSIYTLKMYDYSTKGEADKDKLKMKDKGYIVKEEYQSENTYVVSYHKDTLGEQSPFYPFRAKLFLKV